MKKENFNLPNGLSLLRIIVLPLLIYYFIKGNWIGVAATLGLSALSDFLDGFLARRLNQVTAFGKILDPVADKLTQASVALCMAYHFRQETILIVLLSLFVVKEATMLLGSIHLFKKGTRPAPAKWYGKVATGCFYVSMCSIIFLEGTGHSNLMLTIILTGVSAAFMIYAFVRYVFIFLSLNRNSKQNRGQRTDQTTAS